MKARPNKYNEGSHLTVAYIQKGIHNAELIEAGHVLTVSCHGNAHGRGWWIDPATGEEKDRNVGELLCLVHSEISEAMEGARKNLQDPHLPQYQNLHVEMADAVIRLFDMAGAEGVNLGEIIAAKLTYNANRADHDLANRAQSNGKKF